MGFQSISIRSVYGLLCMGMLLAGCSKESLTPSAAVPGPLELSVGIGAVKSRAVAVSGTQFTHEARLNVVLTDVDYGRTNYATEAVYAYKNPTGGAGVWLPVDLDAPLALATEEARVLAHYPATLPAGASLSNDKLTLTPAVQGTMAFGDLMQGEYNGDDSFWFQFAPDEARSEVFMSASEVDYLCGESSTVVSSLQKEATITLKHCLSMVVFHISKTDDNTAAGTVKSLVIKNASNGGVPPLQSGSFSMTSAAFTPNAAIEYRRTMDNFPDGSYFGMMVFPAIIGTDEVKVELLVDNLAYRMNLQPCTWESGKVTLYNIRLTPTAAELVDMVNVVDWGTEIPDYNFDLN